MAISEPVLSFVDTVLKEWKTGRFEVERFDTKYNLQNLTNKEYYMLKDIALGKEFNFCVVTYLSRNILPCPKELQGNVMWGGRTMAKNM